MPADTGTQVPPSTLGGGLVQMADDSFEPRWYDAAIDGAPRIALGCPQQPGRDPHQSKVHARAAAGSSHEPNPVTDKGKPGVSRGRKATGLGAPHPSS